MKIQVNVTKEQCSILAACLGEIIELYDDEPEMSLFNVPMTLEQVEELRLLFRELSLEGD